MNVGQVTELAREWVETEGSQTLGFCGAHLMGALNYAPADDIVHRNPEIVDELT